MTAADVEVRPSPIEGVGIFARRAFRAGELILRRDESRVVTPEHPVREDLGESARLSDTLAGGRFVLLGYPERHLNHCCDPSAYVRFIDGVGHICARRDIAAGEEITNDYCINSFGEGMWTCACGHPRCRGQIHVNFFEEPLAVQRAYVSLLADWFVAEHAAEAAELRRRIASA